MQNEVYEAMQREAYNVCKNLLQNYVYYQKKSEYKTAACDFYRATAEEYEHEYRGACAVYEQIFDEVFTLTDTDRRKIFPENYIPEPCKGPKNKRIFSGSKTPYEDISIYIEDHMNGILDDYVVKICLDGKTYTELLTYNGEYFEWLNDWYEGEQEIELIDFFPLEDAVKKEK